MKAKICSGLIISTLFCALALLSQTQDSHVKRVGMVIGIKPDKISAYKALHDASNSGVRDLLSKYHMRNFSIFLRQLEDGKYYLFGYYEYTGTDFDADMEKLGAEPRNQEWLKMTDPLQIPLTGEKAWASMQEVYHNN